MKNIQKLLLLSAVCLLSNCLSVPRGDFSPGKFPPRNRQQISQYAGVMGIDTQQLLAINLEAYQALSGLFVRGIPEALLFNAQGEALQQPHMRKSLDVRLKKLLKALPTLPNVDEKPPIKLSKLLQQLNTPEGNKPSQILLPAKAYLFVFYSIDSGQDGDQLLQYCLDHISQYPAPDLQIVWVNIDQQNWWKGEIKAPIMEETAP